MVKKILFCSIVLLFIQSVSAVEVPVTNNSSLFGEKIKGTYVEPSYYGHFSLYDNSYYVVFVNNGRERHNHLVLYTVTRNSSEVVFRDGEKNSAYTAGSVYNYGFSLDKPFLYYAKGPHFGSITRGGSTLYSYNYKEKVIEELFQTKELLLFCKKIAGIDLHDVMAEITSDIFAKGKYVYFSVDLFDQFLNDQDKLFVRFDSTLQAFSRIQQSDFFKIKAEYQERYVQAAKRGDEILAQHYIVSSYDSFLTGTFVYSFNPYVYEEPRLESTMIAIKDVKQRDRQLLQVKGISKIDLKKNAGQNIADIWYEVVLGSRYVGTENARTYHVLADSILKEYSFDSAKEYLSQYLDDKGMVYDNFITCRAFWGDHFTYGVPIVYCAVSENTVELTMLNNNDAQTYYVMPIVGKQNSLIVVKRPTSDYLGIASIEKISFEEPQSIKQEILISSSDINSIFAPVKKPIYIKKIFNRDAVVFGQCLDPDGRSHYFSFELNDPKMIVINEGVYNEAQAQFLENLYYEYHFQNKNFLSILREQQKQFYNGVVVLEAYMLRELAKKAVHPYIQQRFYNTIALLRNKEYEAEGSFLLNTGVFGVVKSELNYLLAQMQDTPYLFEYFLNEGSLHETGKIKMKNTHSYVRAYINLKEQEFKTLPEKLKQFYEDCLKYYESGFCGIGIKIDRNDGLYIIKDILKGSTAERAGLKQGDRIVSIDARTVDSLPTEEAVSLLRGFNGTKVQLKIIPFGGESEKTIYVERTVVSEKPDKVNSQVIQKYLQNKISQ